MYKRGHVTCFASFLQSVKGVAEISGLRSPFANFTAWVRHTQIRANCGLEGDCRQSRLKLSKRPEKY